MQNILGFENYTYAIEEIFNSAFDIAEDFGHKYVGSIHVLLGMFRHRDSTRIYQPCGTSCIDKKETYPCPACLAKNLLTHSTKPNWLVSTKPQVIFARKASVWQTTSEHETFIEYITMNINKDLNSKHTTPEKELFLELSDALAFIEIINN